AQTAQPAQQVPQGMAPADRISDAFNAMNLPTPPTDMSAARRGMPSFMSALGLPGPLSVPQTMPRIPPALPQAPAALSVPAAPIPTPAPNTPPSPTGFLSRLSNGIAAHPNMLLAMGAALLSGRGFGGAFSGAMQGGQLDMAQANQQLTY